MIHNQWSTFKCRECGKEVKLQWVGIVVPKALCVECGNAMRFVRNGT